MVSSIHEKLTGISEASLQAILNRTLFHMACLDPDEVVEGLLTTSLLCDRYGQCLPGGQLRSSGAMAGRGSPPDSMLCICSVAGAMWRTLVSEHCPAEEVLKELLSWLWDRPVLRQDSFTPKDSYILPLTVSFQARLHSALPEQPARPATGAQASRILPAGPSLWRGKARLLALQTEALACLGSGPLPAVRPISGCSLQAIRALNEILLLPSSKVPVQLIFPQLYVAVLFQIFFSMEYTLQDLQDYSQMCSQEDGCPPVSPVRCSVPLRRSLPWAQSLGLASPCDSPLLYV